MNEMQETKTQAQGLGGHKNFGLVQLHHLVESSYKLKKGNNYLSKQAIWMLFPITSLNS